jgi:hypothetical protein
MCDSLVEIQPAPPCSDKLCLCSGEPDSLSPPRQLPLTHKPAPDCPHPLPHQHLVVHPQPLPRVLIPRPCPGEVESSMRPGLVPGLPLSLPPPLKTLCPVPVDHPERTGINLKLYARHPAEKSQKTGLQAPPSTALASCAASPRLFRSAALFLSRQSC